MFCRHLLKQNKISSVYWPVSFHFLLMQPSQYKYSLTRISLVSYPTKECSHRQSEVPSNWLPSQIKSMAEYLTDLVHMKRSAKQSCTASCIKVQSNFGLRHNNKHHYLRVCSILEAYCRDLSNRKFHCFSTFQDSRCFQQCWHLDEFDFPAFCSSTLGPHS